MDAAIERRTAREHHADGEAPEGPAESGRLTLSKDLPLVSALVRAFREAIGHAVARAATVSLDSKTAVHEYRKSIRRARSVLRMLRPALPKRSRRALGCELRGLARGTSLLRDADVLVDLCDKLGLAGAAGETLERVRARVAAHRQALVDEGRAAAILSEGAVRLPQLPELLEAVVREHAPAEALVTAFERTFERARAASERALEERTDDATHDWRKRVKELRYQLEMLAEPAGGPVEGLRQAYATLAKRLGEITDYIALRRYIASHENGLSPEQVEALDEALAARIDDERRLAADPIVEVRARIAALAAGAPGERA